LARAGLALLILLSCLLAASTWRVYGHTWDEPEHLAAGLQLLDRGRYEYDTEHPPIARVLMALGPWLAGAHSFGTPPPDGVQEGKDILYAGGHYQRTLTLARLGVLPFLIVLLVAMWLWARQVARTEGEALLAVGLLASVPPVIGHAALATLDVPGTATTLLALYLMQRWLARGALLDSALFGFVAGVAACTKLSAVPFIGLGLIVSAGLSGTLRWRGGPRRQSGVQESGAQKSGDQTPASAWTRYGLGALILLLSLAGAIVLAYGWRSIELTTVPADREWILSYLFPAAPTSGLAAAISHVQLPEALWDFAEGILAVKAHNDAGHVSFLLGELREGGWWYFYLVALAVKTPLPLLLTGPAGLALLAREGWRRCDPWRLAPASLFVSLLAFASFFSRINIGIRHVLILYPFLALGAASLLAWIWRWGRTHRGGRWGVVAAAGVLGLMGWQVSALWRAAPDYLPYFNEMVPHPERVLVDSDLDWGQDLRRLERRLAQLRVRYVSLAYLGTADLSQEALPTFALLPPEKPVSGWVAITALAREHAPLGYAWLNAYRPLERVGKTIDLYFIPPPARAPGGSS